jgi:hypothetical protein
VPNAAGLMSGISHGRPHGLPAASQGSYTPPLASPWDAIQVAAQAWTAGQRKHQSI